MENNEQNAGQDEQQQAKQTNDQPRSYGDAREPDKSLASDGPVSKSEGTESPDLTDASAENSEENAGIGFGSAAPSGTDPATAGENSTDEDAANPDLAKTETSKGFDRDQEELSAGFDDGDLHDDTDEHIET